MRRRWHLGQEKRRPLRRPTNTADRRAQSCPTTTSLSEGIRRITATIRPTGARVAAEVEGCGYRQSTHASRQSTHAPCPRADHGGNWARANAERFDVTVEGRGGIVVVRGVEGQKQRQPLKRACTGASRSTRLPARQIHSVRLVDLHPVHDDCLAMALLVGLEGVIAGSGVGERAYRVARGTPAGCVECIGYFEVNYVGTSSACM